MQQARGGLGLVGREGELARVESALTAPPAVVLVSGEAGAGKTALVDSVCGSHDRDLVLRGGCFPQVSGVLPFSPLVQALRPLRRASEVAGLPEAVHQALSPLLGAVPDTWDERGRWARSRLYEATLNLFGVLTQESSMLLVLEDLHWVDQATLDLVQFLIANLHEERVGLVLTRRPEEPSQPAWLREGVSAISVMGSLSLTLAPLAPADAEDLVRRHCPDVAQEAIERIVVRGAGNPLFLRELAEASRTGRDSLPQGLVELVELRMSGLGDPSTTIVRALAAAGSPLHHRILAEIDRSHVAAVRDAARAGLVVAVDEDRIALRHALLAEAIYERLLPPDRVDIHRTLAEALHTVRDHADPEDDHAAVEAFHWRRAGMPDRAVLPLIDAARGALSRCAFEAAARSWAEVLELWPRRPDSNLPDRVDVLATLALAQRFCGAADDGLGSLHEAVDSSVGSRRAGLLEQLARHCNDLGDGTAALAAIQEASALSAGGDPGLVARVEATYGAILMIRGEYAASRERCQRVLTATDHQEHAWERSHALRVLGVDLVNLGDIDGAVETMRQALETAQVLADPEPLLRGYVNYSYVLESAGWWDQAVDCAVEGLELAERTGLTLVLAPMLLANQASALIATGRLEDAYAVLRRSVNGPGSPASLRYAGLRLAEVEVALGLVDAAQARLDRLGAGDAADATSAAQFAITSAALALATAEPRRAVEVALAHLNGSAAGTDPTVALRLAAHALRGLALVVARARLTEEDVAREAAEADLVLERAERLAEQAPLPPCLDLLELCRIERDGIAGPVEPARWDELAERFMQHGTHLAAASAWLRSAEIRAVRSGPRTAARSLEAAYVALSGLGESVVRIEVRALARQYRLRLRDEGPSDGSDQRGRRPSHGDTPAGLTRREVEVLNVIRQGASNRQAARALGISERTVGVHVGNLLAKLHARNRTEAVSRASDLGLITRSADG